ncbi:MAG: SDR family oxidoreductase [Myxococcota bacterium]|nr:SDR family oxidoreductase [Myxococcota bacterium]
MSATSATSTAGARGAAGAVRRACVTGASSGIGEAFARRLARDEYALLLVARSGDRLEGLAEELRRSRRVAVEVRAADLTEPPALEALAAELAAAPPELLVNNAGFGTVGPFAELDVAREEQLVRLNVWAVVRLTRAVLPGMTARGHGGVINVSSLAGETPSPFTASYAASKAFVTSFSEAVAEEVRERGVRVQALLPGFTRTAFQERAGVDPSRVPSFAWLTPEKVVEASLSALDRGDVVCVPGAGYRVLSSLQRLAPRALARRVAGAAFRRGPD